MWYLLPKTTIEPPTALKGIAPLACEAGRHKWGNGLQRRRRQLELEATMEYVPGKTKH